MDDVGSTESGASKGVSVALSGGGHRAALFALGVLLYLADADRHRQVTSIASVSGGSMTNGAFAQAADPYNGSTKDQVRQLARAFASTIANEGSFMGPPFGAVRIVTAAMCLIGGWAALGFLSSLWLRVILESLAGVAAGSVLASSIRGWLPRAYIVFVAFSASWALGGPWIVPVPAAVRLLVMLVAIAVWIWTVFAQRSRVCEWAFQRTFYSRGKEATRLDEIHDELDHVFCATELQSSELLYFSSRFVYGYRYGKGSSEGTSLARAVQSSACLPFAFAPRWLKRSAFAFSFELPDKPPSEDRAGDSWFVVLTDGGVYDNMADEWAIGFDGRCRVWPSLRRDHREPGQLIVVNGSAGKGWDRFPPSKIPGAGELAGMLRIKDVLYDQTTAPRRRALVAAFNQAAISGTGLTGALVDIGQSPFDVPRAFISDDRWPERMGRAARALDALGDTADFWDQERRHSAAIPTVLSRLGSETSARLMRHAYVLAMINLSVVLDFPPLPVPTLQEMSWFTQRPT